jgi:DNA-binding MarR family transcriptional regulator
VPPKPQAERRISLLFDVVVLNQRLRTLLAWAMQGADLRPDEYAVYRLLYERGPISPTEIAASMAMPLTTVLGYVNTMTRRRHINHKKNPLDGRS